ncbi:TonB family protein [Methylobacterium sp. NEAU 140]|uniref:TonB family protein n=1 Tax=Methylobacterium sp. NEAU 140 TaxID=3064945 RepID=UPI0027362938|nr:TonB family protein [Methylobacterium sp. NEAU 140]MDP4023358.1 TonB family protein [Methylobacterium sp. NEAU 140]
MSLRARFLPACLLAVLLAALIRAPDPAAAGETAAARRWLSTVVTRIGEADRPTGAAGSGTRTRAGTVEIRIRIARDGSVIDAQVERSSGSAARDAGALAAIRKAGPFPSPPAELLMADGTTELSFPLERPGGR